MLCIMSFGGYIAYSGMQPITVYADPSPMIHFTDLPKEKSVINLDFNTNRLTMEGTADVELNVTQKEPEVRTITKWKIKEKVIEKPVVRDIRSAPFLIKMDKPTFFIPKAKDCVN